MEAWISGEDRKVDGVPLSTVKALWMREVDVKIFQEAEEEQSRRWGCLRWVPAQLLPKADGLTEY